MVAGLKSEKSIPGGHTPKYYDNLEKRRDKFAIKAMQAIINNSDTMRQITKHYNDLNLNGDEYFTVVAMLSYSYADAMLKAKKRNNA